MRRQKQKVQVREHEGNKIETFDWMLCNTEYDYTWLFFCIYISEQMHIKHKAK